MKKSIFKSKRRRRQFFFYITIVALPLLQFCIFYIGVNINSIIMAFQRYDVLGNTFTWAGFDNFKQIIRDFNEKSYMWTAIKNSLIFFVVVLCTTFTATLFSFYIYKKRWFAGVFRVALFIPHIVASITFIIIFKYFTEDAVPGLTEALFGVRIHGLISDPATAKVSIMFFCVFIGFGTQTLMFTSAMSEISESITEAAQLDGITPFKEYLYIVMPMIYPTLVTFLITNIVGIFTNQMQLFGFFGTNADYSLYTIGYMLYSGIKKATMSEYPYLAALGLFFTLLSVPITLVIKKVLNKFDPMK